MTAPTTHTGLAFALKYYGGEVFREWLQRCWTMRFAHGSELTEQLGTPRGGRPGMPDNCYAADELLKHAADAGWIVRAEKVSATREQRFFAQGDPHAYPRYFGYMPTRANAEACIFLASST